MIWSGGNFSAWNLTRGLLWHGIESPHFRGFFDIRLFSAPPSLHTIRDKQRRLLLQDIPLDDSEFKEVRGINLRFVMPTNGGMVFLILDGDISLRIGRHQIAQKHGIRVRELGQALPF